MITNNKITYYHKTLNPSTKLEQYERTVFHEVWVFAGKGSHLNKGYEHANDMNVRIPIEDVSDTSIFTIGDIVAIGEQEAITSQNDLNGKEFYNVTSININNFGNSPHVHLGGK